MCFKETSSNVNKVEESSIKSEHIVIQKSKEAIVAERAEKRKKIMDFVNALDNDELQILQSNLLDRTQAIRTSGRPGCHNRNSPDCSRSELATIYPDCSKRYK